MSRTLSQLASIKVDALSGLTLSKTKSLNELGIESVLDLLTFYPRRYIDRSRQILLRDAKLGQDILVVGDIVKISDPRRTKSKKAVVDVLISDGSSRLFCTFFNQPWRKKQLENESQVAVFGKLTSFGGKLNMVNPVVDLIGNQTGKIIALYPSSEKSNLTNLMVSNLIAEALDRSKEFLDPLNAKYLLKNNLLTRTDALRNIHFPETIDMVKKARERLAFDELMRMQLPLLLKKRRIQNSNRGYRCEFESSEDILKSKGSLKDLKGIVGNFIRSLPFDLTESQVRVIKEILVDMSRPYPMHRLVQGDVGSGKTVVAVCCLIAATQNGYQSALMAPTEVLAEQHYLNLLNMANNLSTKSFRTTESEMFFADSDLKIALLTGKLTKKNRDLVLEKIKSGDIDLVIGTHSLIYEGVIFKNLAAIVIDEQHRFGVEQRSLLLSKSNHPHTLTMTATPIPRSAAMTVFGDLDQSILSDLPKGRTDVRTFWVTDSDQAQVWKKVIDETEKGNRAYVVCPLIEESEKISVASVNQAVEELLNGPLKGIKVGVLHGQLPASEKLQIFNDFLKGVFKVLISTTVIEVGVDVKDATVMVIMDADRFGIAQLHQLRGRVGRSDKESSCYLLTKDGLLNDTAVSRLKALVDSNDGFKLSEIDFALRGFGTLMGTKQKGRSDLKLAKLPQDEKLLIRVKAFLEDILLNDPELKNSDLGVFLKNEVAVFYTDEDTDFLFKS